MFEPIDEKSFYSISFITAGKKNIQSPEMRETILNYLNLDPVRPKAHSAHQLVFDFANKNKKLVGFKCNCGAGIYHRFDEDGCPKWCIPLTKIEMNEIRSVGVIVEPLEVMTLKL